MSIKWTPTPLLTTSFDNNGETLATTPTTGGGGGGGSKSTSIVTGLSRPMRVTVDNNHNGLLYIADTGNHRVLEIEVGEGSQGQGQGQGKTVTGKVNVMHL